MRFMAFLVTFLCWYSLEASPPECPTYKNRLECLRSVDENYLQRMDILDEGGVVFEEDEFTKDLLIAANDIRHFETQACHRTCVN